MRVRALAELPSLDELRATIVGLVQAPATKIARTIAEPGVAAGHQSHLALSLLSKNVQRRRLMIPFTAVV
jgi:hypothetical protein